MVDDRLPTSRTIDNSEQPDLIVKTHRQLIRNLREAGDRLAMFSTHDEDCLSSAWRRPAGICNCGYTTAINTWKELGE